MDSTNVIRQEENEKAKAFLELSIEANKRIEEAYEQVNKKIGTIFSSASTIIAIIAGLGYFVLKEGYTTETMLFVTASLLCLFSAVIVGFFLHRVSDFNYMDPLIIFKKYKDKPLRFLLNKSASTLSDVTADNVDAINSKEKWINLMLFFIFLGLVFATIGFIFFGVGTLNQ